MLADYSDIYSYITIFFYIDLFIFYLLYLLYLIDVKKKINTPDIWCLIFSISFKWSFEVISILLMVYLYYNIKIKNDKDYIIGYEYYLTLKLIKKIIIDIVLFIFVQENNLILLVIKHHKSIYNYLYKLFFIKENNNEIKFVDIQ